MVIPKWKELKEKQASSLKKTKTIKISIRKTAILAPFCLSSFMCFFFLFLLYQETMVRNRNKTSENVIVCLLNVMEGPYQCHYTDSYFSNAKTISMLALDRKSLAQ